MQTRTEHDLLGTQEIPSDAYWGIHTLRAVENFSISGTRISAYRDFIKAFSMVKQAAALTNRELGLLDAQRCNAIVSATNEIISGALKEQFVVDVIQGGAGTSTNMNFNEVIANRGLEHLGRVRGDYDALHPIEHVNLSQSTNDVYPTALRIAMHFSICRLLLAMGAAKTAFIQKSEEFADILKMGRTQLQDAVPMTLGQEFATYAAMLNEGQSCLIEACKSLHEVNLGGTAIGTGMNTYDQYSARAIKHLSAICGFNVSPAKDLISATQDMSAFVQLSSALKRIAINISKTCNDLRLLSSGPQAGLSEINLPARAAGSSIMPGKINPIIPEAVNQVAFEVIGNDLTITMAAEAGQLQLNAFEPIIAHSIFKSLKHLEAAFFTLTKNCIGGITANKDYLYANVRASIGVITALNPYIGYENSSRIAKMALTTGRSVSDIVIEEKLMTEEALEAVLQPAALITPTRFKGLNSMIPDLPNMV
jgi:aspartate ammonia-lyase